MKTTSRILCALLCLIMVFGMIPAGVSATGIAVTEINGNVTNGATEDIIGFPASTTSVSYLSDAGTTVSNEWDGEAVHLAARTDGSWKPDATFNNAACYTFTDCVRDEATKTDKKIYLGGYGMAYSKGLGVNAGKSNADYKLIYTNNNSHYFYAVGGNNGANATAGTESVTFQVYGATAIAHGGSVAYELLAEATVKGCEVAEFLVDITGYKLIWLNTKYSGSESSGRYCAWGNASFIKVQDGIPANGTNVQYLSDMTPAATKSNTLSGSTYSESTVAYRADSPYFVSSIAQWVFVKGVKTGSKGAGLETSSTEQSIYLGYDHIKYTKGLGVWAGLSEEKASASGVTGVELPNWLVYAVPANATNFYAVAGNNGNNSAGAYPVRFEVYGTKSASVDGAEWVNLGSSTVSGWQTAEFCVDISDYTYIKLTHQGVANASGAGAGGNLECAWGNASFLTLPAPTESTVRFDSALSLLARWENSVFAGVSAPAKVVCTYKNNSVSTTFTAGSDYYTVEVPGIAGKEMTEAVSMYLLSEKNHVRTAAVSATVRDHALKYLAEGTNAAYKTALYHMLQFGAAAQNYFKYNTENLANAGLSAYASNAMTGEVSKDGVVERAATVGAEYFYATNLRLEDRINLIFYFQNLPEGCTAEFTWNDGEPVTKTITATGMDGVMMVELNELAVADYKAAVTCTIKDAEGNVVVSAQDSVAGYAFRAVENSSNSKNVCAELLKYAASVDAYLG